MAKQTTYGTLLALMIAAVAAAQSPEAPRPRVREIFVPFEELNVVLEGQPQRVFMTRREFNELHAKARRMPVEKYPHEAAVLSAEYSGTVETGRAKLAGSLVIDVLAEGLHALPLDFSGVGLLNAELDGKPAPLGLGDAGKVTLFVQGQGRHRLELEIAVPQEMTAALQSLSFQLPTPAATKFSLTVPGNVEVRSGADVIRRVVENDGNQTHLDLLLKPGATSLVMTLNNRLLLKQQVVVARSVQVSELTAAYERLHASVSLSVLHGAVERFRFVPPSGFEVTEVTSPLLAQWVVKEEAGRKVLETRLAEPTNETVVLNISAVRAPAVLEDWKWPKLEALDVEGQSAVLGLLLEDRLQALSIDSKDLLRIDNRVLTEALPPSVLEAAPGAPRVRPIVAYYAPQAAFDLSAGFERPPARLNVTSTALLTLAEKAQQVRGSFALLPEREKLFALDFSAPADWKVTSVTNSAGQAMSFDLYPAEANRTRVRVPLPGVPAGQTFNVFFQATHAPAAWLDDWTTTQAPFPVFRVEGASRDVGAVAVRATDDMRVRPETLAGLTPLDEREKARFALSDVATDLAYRYETADYSATLAIERTQPRITARVYNFLRIDHERIAAHYELVYDIAEARTRRLRLTLPASTPASLSIRGMDGVQVTEFTSELAGDARHWTVLLAERRDGRVRLAVDFEDRFSIANRAAAGLPQDFTLPLVKAEQVAYQSGLVAVEGSPELAIGITKHPRKVDVGELVDAEYQPGRRLLGAFGYLGDTAEVTVRVARQPGYALPPTIVQRAELVTLVSVHGLTQTAARYQLRTKAQFIELELPAGSQLWSTFLDGRPGQPQRDGQRILLSLGHASENALRDLQVVYETPAERIALWHTVEAAAPKLFLRASEGAEASEVPVVDLVWQLHVPAGYRLTRTGGTVYTDQIVRRPPPLARVGATLYMLAGGIGEYGMPAPTAQLTEGKFAAMQDTTAEQYYAMPSEEAGAPMAAEAMREPQADVASSLQQPRGAIAGQPGKPTATPAAEGSAGTYFNPSQRARSSAPAPAPLPPAAAMPPVAAPADPQQQLGKVLDGQSATAFEGGDKLNQGKASEGYWALEGVRSLKIDLQQAGAQFTFQSLGEDPKLEATLANRSRLSALAWGVCLLLGLNGLRLTPRSARVKFRYVAAILLIASLVPLTGDWAEELSETFDLAFFTGCLLMAYYLAAAAIGWACHRVGSVARLEPVAVGSAVLLAFCLLGSEGWAQQGAAKPASGVLAELEKLINPGKPVEVPKDAILVPYDGEPSVAADPAQKLLVPYEQYVELWNRAFPDQKIITRPLPAAYALAGARYKATLADGEYLTLVGQLQVDVFSDETVAVPLALEGGVLARATIDGQPARLRVPEAAVVPMAAAKKPAAPAGGNLYLLHLTGKGRKTLSLEIRLKLERQGGWRVATGRLPTAPAALLTLTAPLAKTEIRVANVQDRRAYETTQASETIETTLAAGGAVNVQWRPKVGEGQVDQSLTADSTAVLDIREDGLRLHWQMKLDFRRGQREVFTLRLPKDYLVERVTGTNVRGWEVKSLEQDAAEQELHITLLKAARDSESFDLVLARRMAIGQGDGPQEIETPVVRSADAVLHHGRLLVRRSPQLEVRVAEISGLTRTDSPMDQAALPVSSLADESPLGIRPLATYQFISTPYKLTLEVQRVPTTARASVQTLVKLAEREAKLESRILLHVEGRPLYRVRLLLPAGMKLDDVTAPGVFEQAITDADGRQLLTVYLASGQTGEVPLVVRGTLGKPAAAASWPLPNLQVQDVQAPEGEIVVQADPAFDVRTSELTGLENILLDRTFSWLAAEQRKLARVALGYRGNEYAGQLTLAARQPRVRGFSITNVRVTDRAIEETILLELTIREAGIRQLSFLLPESLKEARISVPLLRQKTIEAVEPLPAGLAGNWVRVKLELQDEVMNQLRVLIEHDRLLTNEKYDAPLPIMETGVTDARYVTIESAGRDEVVVEQARELDVLSRQLNQWRTLSSLLGSEITQAWLARDGAAQPRLTLATKDRTAVETVGARIGLAETWLFVDAHGAYRGKVLYRVDNSTEQFLEVVLPDGARMWTVQVAGEGVKPMRADAAQPQAVRVPLIKTAAGDQDYEVVLKYGGQLPSLRSVSEVSFPLVKTVNINVELSQARLYLPETHHWLDFGGSMTRVRNSSDLMAGFLSYRNRQIERLSQILNNDDAYSRARAANNLKQLKLTQQQNEAQLDFDSGALRQQQFANSAALDAAEQVIQKQDAAAAAVVNDNRARFNDLYEGQSNGRAKNVVQELGGNFYDANAAPAAKPPAGKESFNPLWLEQNKLKPQYESKSKGEASKKGVELQEERKSARLGGAEQGQAANPSQQPQAAGLMKAGEGKPGESAEFDNKDRDRTTRDLNREDESRNQLRRYQQRLEDQVQQQMPARGAVNGPAGGMGGYGAMNAPATPALTTAVPVANQALPEAPKDGKQQVAQAAQINVPVTLASLDVELPSTAGYQEVLFSTPRGEVEITARPVAKQISQRMGRVGWTALAFVLAGLVYLAVRRYGAAILSSRAAAALMLALGILSLVTAVLPLAGLLLAISGFALLIGSLVGARRLFA